MIIPLTVFRYPGGKSKLFKELFPHLKLGVESCSIFCEPFTGGGSVSLNIAQLYPEKQILMNELDEDVFSFWNIVVSGGMGLKMLADKVEKCKPSIQQYKDLKDTKPSEQLDKAFKAIFFNRCSYSGISIGGPLGGFSQKSKYAIHCRWNAAALSISMLIQHRLLAGRTKVTNQDFRTTITEVPEDAFTYCDPPYYQKGSQLYKHAFFENDHHDLRELLSSRKNWALSYDKCAEIDELYDGFPSVDISGQYSINKKAGASAKEQLILPLRRNYEQ